MSIAIRLHDRTAFAYQIRLMDPFQVLCPGTFLPGQRCSTQMATTSVQRALDRACRLGIEL